jgi:tRNA(adenine34) deaminase
MDVSAYMDIALAEAMRAAEEDEIPVGALIVKDKAILSQAHNSNRKENNPTRHAEIKAIEEAARLIGNERLTDCDLYVTKEPCAMCAGAILHARIRRVFIGAEDARFGACGTAVTVCGNPLFNHVPDVIFGIRREECSAILKKFFAGKRTRH